MRGAEANVPTGSFAATAAAGGFAVSPQAGKAMKTAIETALDEIDAALRQFESIKRGTPLGDSPAGLIMAEHNLTVAAGAGSGERVLGDLRAALGEHWAAIDRAIAHYREQDSGTVGSFR